MPHGRPTVAGSSLAREQSCLLRMRTALRNTNSLRHPDRYLPRDFLPMASAFASPSATLRQTQPRSGRRATTAQMHTLFLTIGLAGQPRAVAAGPQTAA